MHRIDYHAQERVFVLTKEFLNQCPVRDGRGAIVHPGIILQKFLDRMPLSMGGTAPRIGLSRATLHRVCHGNGRITVDIATKIERGFGLPAAFFLNQQTEWDLQEVEKNDYSHIKPVADAVISQYALGLVLNGGRVTGGMAGLTNNAANTQEKARLGAG